MNIRSAASVAFFLLISLACPVEAAEIEFFAGSASKPATQELVDLFEAETGHKVKLYFGSSGSLLSQMKIARRGDIYFPGSPDYMNLAEKDGVILADTERIVAYLVPAINVPRENPKGIRALKDLARDDVKVAIGNPHHVCVGLYAVEILERAGLREAVKPRISGYTESCAKTANIVAVNGVDAVLGWRVFEYWNPQKIESVLLLPEQIARISYMPIAVSAFSENPAAAKEFIEYACSEKGKKVFEKWGYLTREEQARKYAPDAAIGGDYVLPEGW